MSSCPACFASARPTSIHLRTTRPFTIERCGSCRLAFATPRPTEAELEAFYTGAYFDGSNPVGGYGDYEGDSWAEPNARRMWSLVSTWEPALAATSSRRVLDVGCATGEFAVSMQEQGWSAAGVELADDAREKAAVKGVETYRYLNEVQGSFGLISMFHVLEHVLEPVTTLREARDLIEPDGYLLVEVPQWNSVGRYLKRSRWSSLTPPEHINFFTAQSLRTACANAGWTLERADTCHTQGSDRTVEALRQRRYARALLLGASTAVLEKSGRAGYLRGLARPT
jgi:SAM-dependent methyltransferase